GVDLVDEDDARRVGLALLEQVPYPRGPDAHEHLDEVGARHGEERPAGLARDSLRQQRLPRPRRADQQRALRQPTAETAELLRVLQELDDLLELLFRLVRTGHIGEGHLRHVRRQQPRLRLPELESLVAAHLHLADQEKPEADDQQPGEDADDHRPPVLPRLHRTDLGAPRLELRDQLLVHALDELGTEALDRAVFHGDGRAQSSLELARIHERDRRDVAVRDVPHQLAVGELRHPLIPRRHELDRHDRDQEDEQPEGERLREPAPPARPAVSVAFAIRHSRYLQSPCDLPARLQARDERQVPVVFAEIQAVADEELAGCIEADPAWFPDQVPRDALVQQGAQIEAPRPAPLEEGDQPVQRRPTVNDVLDQEHVLTLEGRLRVVEQPDLAAADRAGAVAAGHQEIHVERPRDLSDQ